MNNMLIDGIVSCLKDTQLSIEEAIKKAWYYDLTLNGIMPSEKELATVNRKVYRDERGIWHLSYKKSANIYEDVDGLSNTAKNILESFIDLGYDYIYKYKFGIALAHSYDYGLYVSEPHSFRTQILETKGIFNSLETECLYEIKKLLDCKIEFPIETNMGFVKQVVNPNKNRKDNFEINKSIKEFPAEELDRVGIYEEETKVKIVLENGKRILVKYETIEYLD